MREKSSRTSGEGVQSQALVEVAVKRKNEEKKKKTRAGERANNIFPIVFHNKIGPSLLKHK